MTLQAMEAQLYAYHQTMNDEHLELRRARADSAAANAGNEYSAAQLQEATKQMCFRACGMPEDATGTEDLDVLDRPSGFNFDRVARILSAGT